jgi:hypothetical protein
MNKSISIYNHFSKLNLIRIIFLLSFFTFSVNYTFNLYDSFTNNFTVNSYDIDSDSNEESEENESENEVEDLDECFFNSTLSNHLNSGSLLNTTKFNFSELSLFIDVDSPPPIC